MGFISGKAKLMVNQGAMAFGKPVDLLADGKPIEGANLGPCVADWDGDGTPDLILGDGGQTVRLFKGSKAADGFTFAAPIELIGPKAFPIKSDLPGGRSKVSVADWNGDGKLDLLVGDFSSSREVPKNLSATQLKRKADLEAEQDKLYADMEKITKPIMARVTKKLGYGPDAKTPKDKVAAFYKAYQAECEKDKAYLAMQKRASAVYGELVPLVGEYKADGFVRVYLRK